MVDIKQKPKLLVQVCRDLWRQEAYRFYAYPDPRSMLAKKYKAYKWGFKPAREILNLIGQSANDGLPWTVGVGYTIGVTPDSTMTEEIAQHKLEEHVVQCANDLEKIYPNWKNVSFVTQTVLLNLVYNMGIKGFSKFVNTLKFITAGDYDAAANGLKKSLWYQQVGTRGVELVERLRTQTIPEEYLV